MRTALRANKAPALEEALRLRRSHHFRRALKILQGLARTHPTSANVFFYLAVTLDNIGREAQAIPRYHRALRLDPHGSRAYEIHLYLASSYRKTHRPRAALRHLREATRCSTKHRNLALESQIHRLAVRDLHRRRGLSLAGRGMLHGPI